MTGVFVADNLLTEQLTGVFVAHILILEKRDRLFTREQIFIYLNFVKALFYIRGSQKVAQVTTAQSVELRKVDACTGSSSLNVLGMARAWGPRPMPHHHLA